MAGVIEGTELYVPAGSSGELLLQVADNVLRIVSAQGNLALAKGQSFVRATAASCD